MLLNNKITFVFKGQAFQELGTYSFIIMITQYIATVLFIGFYLKEIITVYLTFRYRKISGWQGAEIH